MEGVAHVVLAGVVVVLEQVLHGEEVPGQAETALEGVGFPESLLDVAEVAVGREAFRGRDLRAVRARGEDEARLRDAPVDAQRACATVAVVAADVGTGQPQFVADDVDEQAAILDADGAWPAVDGEGDGALGDSTIGRGGAVLGRDAHDAPSRSSVSARWATTPAIAAR